MNFNETRLHESTLNHYTHAWMFSHLSIASVDGKQRLTCSRRISIVRKMTELQEQRTWFRLCFGEKPDSCGSPGSLLSWYQEISQKKILIKCSTPVIVSFSLQCKFDDSTKHYNTQMLLAMNWRYWQAEKNLRMHIDVQGRLMQARFIEIHQVFAKRISSK